MEHAHHLRVAFRRAGHKRGESCRQRAARSLKNKQALPHAQGAGAEIRHAMPRHGTGRGREYRCWPWACPDQRPRQAECAPPMRSAGLRDDRAASTAGTRAPPPPPTNNNRSRAQKASLHAPPCGLFWPPAEGRRSHFCSARSDEPLSTILLIVHTVGARARTRGVSALRAPQHRHLRQP